jgi:hypothetical protein
MNELDVSRLYTQKFRYFFLNREGGSVTSWGIWRPRSGRKV